MQRASSWSPKPWLAALLSILFSPFGMLYVALPKWALTYFALQVLVSVIDRLAGQPSIFWAALSVLIIVVCAVHAYWAAKRYPANRPRPWYSHLRFVVLPIVSLIALIFFLRIFFYEPFRAPSSAMAPTLPRGSTFLIKKWGYGHYGVFGISIYQSDITSPLRRGDVIVFDYPVDPNITYVKRLIGLPGDLVTYKDKVLSVNGKLVKREAIGEKLDDADLKYTKIFQESIDGSSYSIAIDENVPPSPSLQHVRQFSNKEMCHYEATGFSCRACEARGQV